MLSRQCPGHRLRTAVSWREHSRSPVWPKQQRRVTRPGDVRGGGLPGLGSSLGERIGVLAPEVQKRAGLALEVVGCPTQAIGYGARVPLL